MEENFGILSKNQENKNNLNYSNRHEYNNGHRNKTNLNNENYISDRFSPQTNKAAQNIILLEVKRLRLAYAETEKTKNKLKAKVSSTFHIDVILFRYPLFMCLLMF